MDWIGEKETKRGGRWSDGTNRRHGKKVQEAAAIAAAATVFE